MRFGVDQAKGFFFDRAKVLNALAATEVRVLSRIGAFIRTSAQRLMRTGGKKGAVSRPGEPPRTHDNPLLKKFLYFAYDTSQKSVVIGPTALNWLHFQTSGLGLSDTIPAILEYGGEYRVFEERFLEGSYSTQWFRVDLRRRDRKAWLRFTDAAGGKAFVADEYGKRRETRLRTVKIAPRPYMAPAYAANKSKLMDLWRDALNKAA